MMASWCINKYSGASQNELDLFWGWLCSARGSFCRKCFSVISILWELSPLGGII